MRLEIKSDGTGRTLTINVGSGGSLKLDKGFLLSDSTVQGQMTNPLILGALETYMVDFWTHNGGLTVYAKLAGEFE